MNNPGPGHSTRRTILRGSLAVALLAAAPPGVRAQQKAAKSLVQYVDKPKGDQRCDRCLQWLPPDSCKLVAGQISAQAWCALFAIKPK